MALTLLATAPTGAIGWPLTCSGKTLASATLKPFTPCTRHRKSTTLVDGEGPIRAVPMGWYSVKAFSSTNLSSSSSVMVPGLVLEYGHQYDDTSSSVGTTSKNF